MAPKFLLPQSVVPAQIFMRPWPLPKLTRQQTKCFATYFTIVSNSLCLRCFNARPHHGHRQFHIPAEKKKNEQNSSKVTPSLVTASQVFNCFSILNSFHFRLVFCSCFFVVVLYFFYYFYVFSPFLGGTGGGLLSPKMKSCAWIFFFFLRKLVFEHINKRPLSPPPSQLKPAPRKILRKWKLQ